MGVSSPDLINFVKKISVLFTNKLKLSAFTYRNKALFRRRYKQAGLQEQQVLEESETSYERL